MINAASRRRRTIRGVCFLVVVATFVLPLCRAADLLDVYHRALDSDPTFASARYVMEATRQKLPQAVSALLPALTANVTTDRTYGKTQYTGTEPVTQGFDSSAWTLQLSQPLLRMQNIYGYEESKRMVDQATAQFEQARQDLMLRTAQAYFDVLLAQDAITVARQQQQSAAEQQAVAQHGFDDGTNSITDVDEARARAELARAQLSAAQSDLETKQAALQQIVGDDWAPRVLSSLSAYAQLPRPRPEAVEPWVAQARDDNAAVRAAKAVCDAAKIDINRARALRLPTLDLIASYGGNYSSGNITDPLDYATRANDKQIGLQFAMPIVDGGGIHSQNVQARLEEQKAAADWEAARRKAATDARQAYSAVLSGFSQVEALQSAVESSANAVKGNQAGYRAGLRINSDVLDSVQQLGSAQQDLAKARVELVMQGLKLKAAAGILNDGDLEAVNRLLSISVDGSGTRGMP